MNPLTLDTLVASLFSLYMLHENIQEDNIQTSGTAPQKVEQVLKWGNCSKNYGTESKISERFKFGGSCNQAKIFVDTYYTDNRILNS